MRHKADAERTPLPDGYRMTELGPLPEEWRVVRLGEVTQLVRGISWRKIELSSNGIPVIAIPNIRNGRVSFDIRYRVIKKISKVKRLYEGDILLVGSSGSPQNVGRTAIVRGLPFRHATFASFLIKIIASSIIERDYLYYLLSSQVVDFVRCSKRAADGKYNLQVGALKEYPIPLPPLPEQRAIAHVLRAVQQAREATEDVIAAARELKRSLMHRLFTYGPGREPAETKMTEIGEIPKHWKVARFSDCVDIVSGQVDPRITPYREMLHVGPENVEPKTGRVLSLQTAAQLKLKSGKYLFTNEHVVYSKIRPYLVKVFLPNFVGICSADMYPLKPKGNVVTREYLFHYLLTDVFTEQAVAHQARTGIPKINRTQLSTIVIPLPPGLDEQKQIAKMLQAADFKIAAEEDRLTALQALFKSMLHQLMTGQIRLLSDEGLPLDDLQPAPA